MAHSADPASRILFDFTTPEEFERWNPIDDRVMGGVSRSRLSRAAEGVARFSGLLSLDNNGGFASVRSEPRNWKLGGCTGLALRVRGDGKDYRFRIKTDANFDGVVFQAPFQSRPEWSVVHLSFESFRPSYRGRERRGVPPLDPAGIRSLGLMIADGQAGPFSLELDWIAAE